MPIFQHSTTTPAQQAANTVMAIALASFRQLATSGVNGFNLIWSNKNATPAEILTALGTNAKAVFELAELNIETVASAAAIGGVTPPTIPAVPPQYTLTFNEDGSANLVEHESSSSDEPVQS